MSVLSSRLPEVQGEFRYLLQRLVVDEAGRIFGKIKLPALDLLSELPARGSALIGRNEGSSRIGAVTATAAAAAVARGRAHIFVGSQRRERQLSRARCGRLDWREHCLRAREIERVD